MKPLTILAFTLLALVSVSYANSDSYRYYGCSRYSRCCRLKNYYRRLYCKYRRQCPKQVKQYKIKVKELKKTLDLNTVVLKHVPSSNKKLTPAQLHEIKTKAISALSNLTFGVQTTPTVQQTTTVVTTPEQPPEPQNPKQLGHGLHIDPKYVRKFLYDGLDDFEDDYEDVNDDEEDIPSRKRRNTDADTSSLCPMSREQILATLEGLPAGTNGKFSDATNIHQNLNNVAVRSCIECRYVITLPQGYHPRLQQHVICPTTSKPNCIGGFGQCGKLEVDMNIYREGNDGSGTIRANQQPTVIRFNKGCTCLFRTEFVSLTDGNF